MENKELTDEQIDQLYAYGALKIKHIDVGYKIKELKNGQFAITYRSKKNRECYLLKTDDRESAEKKIADINRIATGHKIRGSIPKGHVGSIAKFYRPYLDLD